jgi:pyridoxamine 5'-phosphate oxidase
MNPLERLGDWITVERSNNNLFAHGAVLGTQGVDGMPHTRMLGVSFDSRQMPKFHTSPRSRKVGDIHCCNRASLTFAFQQSMRSISLEGLLEPLSEEELNADWQILEPEFRRNYWVFGARSGEQLEALQELHAQQDLLPEFAEKRRPCSFIGYRFQAIQRICFYSVAEKDFAHCELYEFDLDRQTWIYSLRVP